MANLSPIDQRLAAHYHTRQIDNVSRADALAALVGLLFDRAFEKLVTTAAGAKSRASVVERSEAIAEKVWQDVLREVGAGLRKQTVWGYESGVDAFLNSVPLRWFKVINPLLPEDIDPVRSPADLASPSDLTGLLVGVGVDVEPVQKVKYTKKEKKAIIKELVFPPLTKERVEKIVYSPAPDGETWDTRLQRWSKRVASPEMVAQQLANGYSQGENIQQLRKRIQPLVGNQRSAAQRVARTEARRVAEMAQRESWAQIGDMLAGAQILAVLDQNTRPHHAARNGTIYWQRGSRARGPYLDEIPVLPDEPNCRCTAVPVLQPPEEFLNDPAVRAQFKNAGAEAIPDPAAYSQWFKNADLSKRKKAVGAKRYETIRKIVNAGDGDAGEAREPEWIDFIDPKDGKLLTVERLARETSDERAARRQAMATLLAQREQAIRQVAEKGFVVPERGKRTTDKKPSKATTQRSQKAGVKNKPAQAPPVDTEQQKRQRLAKQLISVSGSVSDEFQQSAMAALERVPSAVLQRFVDFGGSVKLSDLVSTVRPDLKGVTPRGWPAGMTWDNSDGLYSPSGLYALVTEFRVNTLGQKVRSFRVQGTILHELGHGLDDALNALSRSAEFLAVYTKEAEAVEAIGGEVAKALSYILQKRGGSRDVGASEVFAEGFAVIVYGSGSGMERMAKLMQEHFPRTLESIRKALGL